MRRKRLQHAADNLCQMFCGWRLHGCYPELERLGSGTLVVDVLAEACTFEGEPIPALGIARELAAWLREDLAAHHIDVERLREARVTVEVRLGTVPKAERRTRDSHFGPGGRHLVPPRFVACDLLCRSRVATDEKVYASEYRDYEEWPPGWPGR
ncbi:MAG TPA: hypothetical protein VF746_16390 [Longimicrobium sp.]|jgi:hypothetical protein